MSIHDFESEESFLKYLLGWNNTMASHLVSLLKNPQRIAEDDLKFRKDTLEKWGLPFDEEVHQREVSKKDDLDQKLRNLPE